MDNEVDSKVIFTARYPSEFLIFSYMEEEFEPDWNKILIYGSKNKKGVDVVAFVTFNGYEEVGNGLFKIRGNSTVSEVKLFAIKKRLGYTNTHSYA